VTAHPVRGGGGVGGGLRNKSTGGKPSHGKVNVELKKAGRAKAKGEKKGKKPTQHAKREPEKEVAEGRSC